LKRDNPVDLLRQKVIANSAAFNEFRQGITARIN